MEPLPSYAEPWAFFMDEDTWWDYSNSPINRASIRLQNWDRSSSQFYEQTIGVLSGPVKWLIYNPWFWNWQIQENMGIDLQSLAQPAFHSYWKCKENALKNASLHTSFSSKNHSVVARDGEKQNTIAPFHLSFPTSTCWHHTDETAGGEAFG